MDLANRVNRDRNDVGHGNPVRLRDDSVADSIAALLELQKVVELSALWILDQRAGWDGKEPHD